MNEQNKDLEKYIIQQEKRIETLKKELENLQYKQILCELLLFLRGYYENKMLVFCENDIRRLEIVGGHEVGRYFSCNGFFEAYSDIADFLRDKLPEDVSNLLLF